MNSSTAASRTVSFYYYIMLRLLLIFIPMSFVGQLNAQQKPKFEFWISSLDKAGYDRVTYHVTEDSIIVKDGPYDFIYFSKNYQKDKVIFRAKLDSLEKTNLYVIASTIRNDSLKSQYTNLCIIDGMILHFHFEWSDNEKSTTLSNYYIYKMTPFVDFVNRTIPQKYKIWYDKEELEKQMKDCPKNRILD